MHGRDPRPAGAGEPVRLLAVRDEERDRPWRGLGPWWPERGGVLACARRPAGGAWLAVDPGAGRLAVLLNRDDLSGRPDHEVVSRGGIPLDAVGVGIPDRPATRGFNLVEVDAEGAHLTEWTASKPARADRARHPHDRPPRDRRPATPRIGRWLDDFRHAGVDGGEDWWMPWLDVVARATSDPSASVLRRDEHDGHVLESLLVCAASVGTDGVDVRQAIPRPTRPVGRRTDRGVASGDRRSRGRVTGTPARGLTAEREAAAFPCLAAGVTGSPAGRSAGVREMEVGAGVTGSPAGRSARGAAGGGRGRRHGLARRSVGPGAVGWGIPPP